MDSKAIRKYWFVSLVFLWCAGILIMRELWWYRWITAMSQGTGFRVQVLAEVWTSHSSLIQPRARQNRKDVNTLLNENRWQIGIMVVGMMLVVTGIVVAGKEASTGNEVVVTTPEPSNRIVPASAQGYGEVKVDVEGAVIKPGVYSLHQGDRVADALIAAGGVSLPADRSYVARFINQAELLRDGMKIYVPAEGEKVQSGSQEVRESGSIKSQVLSLKSGVNGIISINSSSEGELDVLEGIGEARVNAIISNRPYSSIDELVTKAKIPKSIVDKNRDKLGL